MPLYRKYRTMSEEDKCLSITRGRRAFYLHFFPVGTQFSQAVGVAMASAYKGLDEVCITWLGDGTSAQGDYHYGLNFASHSKHQLS